MHDSQHLEPYLGPRAILSQSWLSQPLLSLLLVFVSLAFVLTSIKPATEDAKLSLEAACRGTEQAANVVVSLPHFMADSLNEINSKAVDHAISGAATVIDLVLVAITQIVLFAIDVYKSLFLCLMDLAVHGSLTLLIQAAQEVDDFVTRAFQGVRSGLQDAVQGINSGLDSTLGLIERIPGVDFDIPQIDVPDLAALENVTLPHSIIDGLESLNNSIPTLEELKATIDTFISAPVNDLRASVNATLRNASLDIDKLPVPDRQSVELCTRLDTSWLDQVAHDVSRVIKISMAVVSLAALVLVLVTVFMAHRRNKAFLSTVSLVKSSWLSSLSPLSPPSETLSTIRLVTHHSSLSNPILTSLTHKLYPASALDNQQRQRTRSRLTWFLLYISNTTGLALLAFGIVGLLAVQIQIRVLNGPVTDLARTTANQGAREFGTNVQDTVNGAMLESAKDWETEMNKRIHALETTVNRDLFDWINNGTTAVNSTINEFYAGLTNQISDVFNGTVLQDPITGLCLIGSKVAALSTALTWLHSNLHLSLPRASSSSLVLSPERVSHLSESVTQSNSSVSTENLVDKMIRTWIRNLEQARVGFAISIALWIVLVIEAVVVVFWDIFRDGKNRGRESEKNSNPLKPLRLAGEFEKSVATNNETDNDATSWTRKIALTFSKARALCKRSKELKHESSFERIDSPRPTNATCFDVISFDKPHKPDQNLDSTLQRPSTRNASSVPKLFSSIQRQYISPPEYISSTSLPHLDMSQPAVPFSFQTNTRFDQSNRPAMHAINPFATPFDAIDETQEPSQTTTDSEEDDDDEDKGTDSKVGPWNLDTIAVAR
ncbi:plasma membrane fusion protein prm1 [Microbotryomycetes sp. JL201]|nr:plasma membrane fusion protein prm1 [Microbotryomycetes sp. JL201]